MANDSRIEGFVAGNVAITVSNLGGAVTVTSSHRLLQPIEAIMSVDQSRRLRRLLAAAEKRAGHAMVLDQ